VREVGFSQKGGKTTLKANVGGKGNPWRVVVEKKGNRTNMGYQTGVGVSAGG